MLNLGGAFIAARLNDAFRDVQQLIPFVLRLLQYTSGVMFSIDRVLTGDNVWAQRFIMLNPIVSVLDCYRWMILGTPLRLDALGIAIVESVALLVFGFRFFRAAEHSYGKP
jgi:teichoic acid transport system permease protein